MKCFLILLLFLSSSLVAAHKLAICTIFQDEAEWFDEWIQFHKLQGVDHFYLYNNNSQDHFLEVLQPYIARLEVTLVDWPYSYDAGEHERWFEIQCGAYMDCIERFGADCDWLAVIDTDEFLFCPSGKKLPDFLENYKEYAALGANWLCFGTSDVEEIPQNQLLIEMLTQCAKKSKARNLFYKSIVQPQYVVSAYNPHFFLYKEGHFAVDAHFEPLRPEMRANKILLDEIRINHYWTRTVRYMRKVKIPNRQKRNPGHTPFVQWQMAAIYNEMHDEAILQFVEPLREVMSAAAAR